MLNRSILFFLVMIFCTGIFAETPSQLPVNVSYDYELIKFYILKQEYDLALSRIIEIQNKKTDTDSLHYFKGLAYKGKSKWELATDEFANILIYSSDRNLIKTVINEFAGTLNKMDAFITIEKISQTLEEVNTPSTRIRLLLMIAEIYEDNQLYSEANDVYRTVINENIDSTADIELKLKIIANDLFLKNFEQALNGLNPVLALNDSIYNQTALFFNYIAHHSLNNFYQAKTSLLILYNVYPNHIKRREIIKGLASLYKEEKKYLLSWYLYTELIKISDEKQLHAIQFDIKELKQLIVTDSDYINPFENIIPVFPEIDHIE